MKKKLTSKQLINVELSTRSFNTKAKEVIKNHSPKEVQSDLLITFQCECSDENCQERVPLTLKEYEEIHKNRARFVLAKGHVEPKVEKVTAKTSRFVIVEKPALQTEQA